MYGAPPDTRLPPAGASAPSDNGGPQPIVQLAAALVELGEAQHAMDKKLAQLVNINRQTLELEETLAAQLARSSPVTVQNINMSFGSMVVFMVKWAVAAIPAAIILLLLWAVAMFFGTLMLAILVR